METSGQLHSAAACVRERLWFPILQAWVDHRVRLDVVVKRIIPVPRQSNPI